MQESQRNECISSLISPDATDLFVCLFSFFFLISGSSEDSIKKHFPLNFYSVRFKGPPPDPWLIYYLI